MDGKLDMGQHCALMTLKANRILNCIKRRGANRAGEMILPLCSVLLRPHLEYFVHMWSPRYRRNMDLLERAQRRVAKMIQGMEPFLRKQTERAGAVQPGEEKAPRAPTSCGFGNVTLWKKYVIYFLSPR